MQDWRKFVNSKPVNAFQERISIKEPKYLRIVGYFNCIDTKGVSNVGGHEDSLFSNFLAFKKKQDLFDRTKYVVTRDTHANVNASVLKYDKEPADFSKLDPATFAAALEDCKMFFRPLHDSCPILEYNDLSFVPDTSPGFKYKRAGCKSKIHALDKFGAEIRSAWNTLHVEKTPVLWKQASKIELLKSSKVDCGDLRGFTCPPLDYLLCCMRMNSSFNEKSHDYAADFNSFITRVGYVLQRGGFSRLLKRHDRPGCFVGEGDADKYDSNIADWIFYNIVLPVRYVCWDKKGMSEDEWWQRQLWYYEQKVKSFILLPSGQIVQKDTGNPSGQDSTGDDNGIIHAFILCYTWRDFYKRSLYEDRDVCRLDLYSDDHVFSCPFEFDRFASYQERAASYALFGVQLSKAKDLVTTSPEGHTFLGPKAIKYRGEWVPLYNRDKVLCAALKMEKKFEPPVLVGRIISLLLNAPFDEDAFSLLREYAFDLYKSCGSIVLPVDSSPDLPPKWLYTVPSLSEVRAFWMGYEDKRPKRVPAPRF